MQDLDVIFDKWIRILRIENNWDVKLELISDESFDLIFHPASNCYVKNVLSIFKECYRVLKKAESY